MLKLFSLKDTCVRFFLVNKINIYDLGDIIPRDLMSYCIERFIDRRKISYTETFWRVKNKWDVVFFLLKNDDGLQGVPIYREKFSESGMDKDYTLSKSFPCSVDSSLKLNEVNSNTLFNMLICDTKKEEYIHINDPCLKHNNDGVLVRLPHRYIYTGEFIDITKSCIIQEWFTDEFFEKMKAEGLISEYVTTTHHYYLRNTNNCEYHLRLEDQP